jgi:6-pyruvoyltetrahydropterin/6-carboxytetrahydropterin synthase
MMRVRKTYGHNEGWSCTFRQWRAESHCHFIHGYALSVELEFVCDDDELDPNGWVIDFGGLKEVKAWLKDLFDHKTLVAADDPALPLFQQMAEGGRLFDLKQGDHVSVQPLIQLTILENGVGCDKLTLHIRDHIQSWLEGNRGRLHTKADLSGVWVREHEGNGAGWTL